MQKPAVQHETRQKQEDFSPFDLADWPQWHQKNTEIQLVDTEAHFLSADVQLSFNRIVVPPSPDSQYAVQRSFFARLHIWHHFSGKKKSYPKRGSAAGQSLSLCHGLTLFVQLAAKNVF